jgi:hypothetical protein
MTVGNTFRERLSSQATDLLKRYVAECIESGRTPDITWEGELKVPRKALFGTRLRVEHTELAGWRVPNIAGNRDWVLENGAWCRNQHYIHFLFGRRTGETDELEYRNVDEMSFASLQSIILALRIHFEEIPIPS